MRGAVALALLTMAAVLEVGGDAAMRLGLRGNGRWLFLGAGLLILYGIIVNQPAWHFNRLMGIYIAVFFVVSQLVAWVLFREAPTVSVFLGGTFIVMGGAVLYLTS